MTLGRTGLTVGRLGISASYGVAATDVERAFERGVNYLYWGSLRRDGFGEALRNLSPRRDRMVVVIQSYSRIAGLVGWSLERALRKVRLDYADILLLGYWNHPIAPRILDAGLKLQQRGLARHLAISTHQRLVAAVLAPDPRFGAFHVRYNAEHRGAELDLFPKLPSSGPPGMVAFTATSWGRLLDPRRAPQGERVPSAADCYRFAMSNPAVDVCMTGPSNARHVTESLAALEAGPMSPEEIAWMRRVGDAVSRGRSAA